MGGRARMDISSEEVYGGEGAALVRCVLAWLGSMVALLSSGSGLWPLISGFA